MLWEMHLLSLRLCKGYGVLESTPSTITSSTIIIIIKTDINLSKNNGENNDKTKDLEIQILLKNWNNKHCIDDIYEWHSHICYLKTTLRTIERKVKSCLMNEIWAGMETLLVEIDCMMILILAWFDLIWVKRKKNEIKDWKLQRKRLL